jgi:hypothetical protein
MTKRRFKPNLWMAVFVLVVYGVPVVLLLLSAQDAQAALPPRPSPVPTATQASPSALQPPAGATIALHVSPVQAGLWTMVQWQDAFGRWHDVEGWQGTLNEIKDGEGMKTWWVAQANLGQGPFRWVVYQEQDGPPLIFSDPFNLPDAAKGSVTVDVALEP